MRDYSKITTIINYPIKPNKTYSKKTLKPVGKAWNGFFILTSGRLAKPSTFKNFKKTVETKDHLLSVYQKHGYQK